MTRPTEIPLELARRRRARRALVGLAAVAIAVATVLLVEDGESGSPETSAATGASETSARRDASSAGERGTARAGSLRPDGPLASSRARGERRSPREASSRSEPSLAREPATSETGIVVVVLDRDTAAPLANESLSLRLQGANGIERVRGSTDANGRVALDQLRPGIYALTVSGDSFVTAHVPVRLAEHGDPEEVIVRVERGHALEGQVVGSSGEPVAHANVVAFLEGDEGPARRQARADSAGRFAIGGLAPGAWSISATSRDHVGPAPIDVAVPASGPLMIELRKARVAMLRIEEPSGRPLEGARVYARIEGFPAGAFAIRPAVSNAEGKASLRGLVGDDESAIRFDVEHPRFPPRSIERTLAEILAGEIVVRFEAPSTLRGEVFDSDGKPVRDAVVSITGRVERTLRSTSEGIVLFRDVPPGKYEARATTTALGASESVAVYVEPDSEATVRLVLSAGEHEISGTILAADGSPAGLVSILLSSSNGARRAITDEQGRFRFAGLGDGAYDLRAKDARGSIELTGVRPGDGELALTLARNGKLEGVIAIGESDQPRASGELAIALEPTSAERARGVRIYRFSSPAPWFEIDGVPEGDYELRVLRNGEPIGAPREVTVSADDAEPLWIDLGAP